MDIQRERRVKSYPKVPRGSFSKYDKGTNSFHYPRHKSRWWSNGGEDIFLVHFGTNWATFKCQSL